MLSTTKKWEKMMSIFSWFSAFFNGFNSPPVTLSTQQIEPFNAASVFELVMPGIYRMNPMLIPNSMFRHYDDAIFQYRQELEENGALVAPEIGLLDSPESIHFTLYFWLQSAHDAVKTILAVHGCESDEYRNAQELISNIHRRCEVLPKYESLDCWLDEQEKHEENRNGK